MAVAVPQTEDPAYAPATGGALGKKGIGWALFEFARNPYYNVIVISLYAPYFSNFVVGDETRGQAMVGWTIAIAGIIMALVAPVLGGLVDIGGRRKFPIALSLATLGITAGLLWYVAPDLPYAVPIGMGLMATGYIAYSVSELFHNAMLPMAAKPSSLPIVSGLGISLGNFASILFLVLLSIFITGTDTPLFGLDPENGETSRVSGPLVGVWLAVFIIPFFVFMPDIAKTPERSWRRAARTSFSGKGGLFGLIGAAATYVREMFRLNPNVMRFLVGRMVYADGIAALLTLGSVYVGGVLGWGANQLVLAGIVGGLCAVIGALMGGLVDQRVGPKRSIMIELSVIIVILTLQLSITPDGLLFGLIPAGQIVWDGGPFPRLSDLTYILMLIPASMMLGAVITSSRYMLVHIAPPEHIGRFFGFYAMSGSVTVWIGPGLVALMTTLSGSQRVGMSGLGLLFIIGLWIVSGVKADKTPEHLKDQPTA